MRRVVVTLAFMFVGLRRIDAQRTDAQLIVSEATPPAGPFTYFGSAATRIVGETFSVLPTAPVLQYFGLWLGVNRWSVGVTFTPYVKEWDGSQAVGPAIWSGPEVTTATDFQGYKPFFFATGGLLLTPGQMYVAYFETAKNGSQSDNVGVGCTCVEATNPDFLAVAADDPGGVVPSTGPWSKTGYSASFEAGFDAGAPIVATPEPEPIVLTASGFIVVFGVGIRRRRNGGKAH